MRHAYAGVFLVVDGTVIGLLRDDVAGIDNPGRIGPFGGTVEPGEEPLAAGWMELVEEETNLCLAPADLEPFASDVAWRALSAVVHDDELGEVLLGRSEAGMLEVDDADHVAGRAPGGYQHVGPVQIAVAQHARRVRPDR